MNPDLRKENIEILKEKYLDFIKEMMQEEASLPPSLTVFCEVKEQEEFTNPDEIPLGLVHIPIPGKFMKDDESKDELVDEVIPQIFDKVKEKFIPYAIAWASEVWITAIKKTDEIQDVDQAYQKALESPHINKQEAVYISIDSEEGNEIFVYNIHRDGKQINADGDLVDTIRLEKNDLTTGGDENKFANVGGRFANLFHKLK